jgi:hypothetical protein
MITFQTKAQTLRQLENMVKKSSVLPQVNFALIKSGYKFL